MYVIADSGSTKTSWLIIDNTETRNFETIGFNPYFIQSDGIISELDSKFSETERSDVEAVFFYGSGCNEDKKHIVLDALKTLFQNANIEVNSDILGAARATLQQNSGIVGILGTGSNICLYNGTDIVNGAVSLGWILGDEGGGVYLGKLFLKAYLSNTLPNDLLIKFNERYCFKRTELIDQIYRKPFANRFVAGFAPFLLDNVNHEFVQAIVKQNFNDYFDKMVAQIPNFALHKKCCVGSIAHFFSKELISVAEKRGVEISLIMKNPINGLAKYHS